MPDYLKLKSTIIVFKKTNDYFRMYFPINYIQMSVAACIYFHSEIIFCRSQDVSLLPCHSNAKISSHILPPFWYS